MAKFAILSLVCLAGITLAVQSQNAVINPSLLGRFKSSKMADITVTFKQGTVKAYDQIKGRTFVNSAQKMTILRAALILNAEETQQSAKNVLANKSSNYKSFWISNSIVIRQADLSLVQQLAKLAEVEEVREMIVIPVEDVEVTPKTFQNEPQWGVERVKATQIWAMGNTGQNVIVANVDTGVRGTHSILADNFVGEYGWYDPGAKTAAPRDDNGHGTHTMGTIAGKNGYGVAPGSKWMACMGCAGSSCFEDDLIGCGQFTACPTKTDGSDADCSKKPHLVSNSWGSSLGGQVWYDSVIKAWYEGGIITLFSAGNAGPSCSTLGSPGDRLMVIGVAATDINDGLAIFSSVGPPTGSTFQKPEISAPGVDVQSSYNSGDSSFASLSGTSMACPHVAGVVALLLNEKPELIGDFEGVSAALYNGAVKSGLTGFNQNCGGINENVFPNFAFGHGLLDVVGASMTGNATIYF